MQFRSWWTMKISFLLLSCMLLYYVHESIDIVAIDDQLMHLRQHYSEQQNMVPFPRWYVSNDSGTTDYLVILLRAIQNALNPTNTITKKLLPYDLQPSFQNVYIILSQSYDLYKVTVPNTQTQMVRDRANFMEPLVLQLLQEIKYQNATRTSSRNSITPLIQLADNLETVLKHFGGIVYVVSYADAQFCCDDNNSLHPTHIPNFSNNVEGGVTTNTILTTPIPIFTLSAPLHCNYTFPVPTYETIIHTNVFEKQRKRRIISVSLVDRYINYHWWHQRNGRAVWRGSPTGSINMEENVRWKLCLMSLQRPDLIDAKFVGTTQRWPQLINNTNLMGQRIDVRDMQHYRAIIDVDGNSWSGRFGMLLCLSTVVLKIQPSHVDYFYPELQPWLHYIPVKADLSDLIEQIEFSTSTRNAKIVQRVIYNANQWCRNHMAMQHLINDMKNIFDIYASKILLPAVTSFDTQPDIPMIDIGSSAIPPDAKMISLLLRQYNFTRVT
jgi:Glycosyl transferase family 90